MLNIFRTPVVASGLSAAVFIGCAALFSVATNAEPDTPDTPDVAPASAQVPANAGVYELRTYTANPGKLDALHDRFRDHTMRLFERHGMHNVGYWTPTATPDTLVYLLAHASEAAASASWQAFINDPQWQEVYAASIADGRLVANIDKVFMAATDYSPRLPQ